LRGEKTLCRKSVIGSEGEIHSIGNGGLN
jgi:hypothetical protein